MTVKKVSVMGLDRQKRHTFSITLLVWIVFILLSIGCSNVNKRSNYGQNEYMPLHQKQFDSILHILFDKKKPERVSEIIHQFIKETHFIEDQEALVKRYRLISGYYMLIFDYTNADFYMNKLKEKYEKNQEWDAYVRLTKSIAMSYRYQKRYSDMEAILKDGIRIAKEKNVKVYDLLPIHELAVFYSYDVGKHDKAIQYGELFFDKLNHYDSLQIDEKFIREINKIETHVMRLILGRSYVEIDDLTNGYLNLLEAEQHYAEIGDKEKLERTHRNLMDYYLKRKDFNKANEHKKKYLTFHQEYKDSIISSFKKIGEAQLNLVEAEKENLRLKEENKRKKILITAIVIVLLIIIIFQSYFLRLRYQKRSIGLELEKEHEFSKFRASLFMNIAHEIRTPITLILGYLELLGKKNNRETQNKKYFEAIKTNSHKVIDNISDVIYLLKEGKDEEALVFTEVEIEPFLRKQFFSFEGIADLKNIELYYESSLSDNFILKTNRSKLESVINNLVSNSIKFSPKGTRITFRVYTENKSLHIILEDQGSGISRENQKQIFNKFYQEEKNGKSEGFGMGLAIVQDAVNKLNGEISLTSSSEKGTTFRVSFPTEGQVNATRTNLVKRTKKNQEKENEVVLEEVLFRNGQHLLIVEDNLHMTDYYKQILSSHYNCTYVFSGEEALDMLTTKTFDLIISDIMMPGINGIEFRKKVKQISAYEKIPFIIITAMNREDLRIQAFNVGVDDYIIKPFGSNELVARINCLLDNKEERKMWSEKNKEQKPISETYDEKYIKKIYDVISSNTEDENFSVVVLAKKVNLSQRQLERLIKKMTGLTPVKLILEVRLQKAYQKLKNKEEADINNVRYGVGIKSASYFSVKFKQRFGINPSELLRENNNTITKK